MFLATKMTLDMRAKAHKPGSKTVYLQIDSKRNKTKTEKGLFCWNKKWTLIVVVMYSDSNNIYNARRTVWE